MCRQKGCEKYMVTRLELGGKNLARYLAKREIKHTGDSFLVGEFADQAGKYKTEAGSVGLEFALANDSNREVVLFCGYGSILRGKGEERVRRISVDGRGVGVQQLTKGVELRVSTQAELARFQENRR